MRKYKFIDLTTELVIEILGNYCGFDDCINIVGAAFYIIGINKFIDRYGKSFDFDKIKFHKKSPKNIDCFSIEGCDKVFPKNLIQPVSLQIELDFD